MAYELFRTRPRQRQSLKFVGHKYSGYRKRSRRPRRLRVIPGFTRTSGFFGRYRPSTNRFAVTELKFHDLDIDDAIIATGATIAEDSLNAIAQGVTEVTRVGRKCTIRSINARFDILLNDQQDLGDPPSGDIVRVILYLDKQANGATAAVTDILESADYQSFNNLANKSRFRTLMDRTYSMNYKLAAPDGANTASYGETPIHDSFFKKVNIPIEFDATTGAITEVKSNNIGLLLLSKAGSCQFNSKWRLRFSDN